MIVEGSYKRVNEVLDKAAAFDPMLFLSEVAVLQDRVASSEDSGMTTMQAVTKESTDLNTPSLADLVHHVKKRYHLFLKII